MVYVALKPAHGNVDGLATRLRKGTPSICGRVHQDALMLGLRTVFARQDARIVEAVQTLGPTNAPADDVKADSE